MSELPLIIVESPKKARVLSTYFKGAYDVIASYGHVRSLPSKNGSVLPDENFKMSWEVQSKALIELVKKAKGASRVILAADPDREGEAICFHIAEVLKEQKVKCPITRVRFNSIEKETIKRALQDQVDLDVHLIDAYFARLAMDYLVGFNISPILWRKIPGNRSAGRVQSVGLRIVMDREREISAFQSQDYWVIKPQGIFAEKPYELCVKNWDGQQVEQFFYESQAHADRIAEEIKVRKWSVSDVQEKRRIQEPNPPFITATLQQAASNQLGFRPGRTMQLAQELYEGVKIGGELKGLITYMRTDSTAIHPDAAKQCKEVILKKWGKEYVSSRIRKSNSKNAQNAHEAIRPTDYRLAPEEVAKYTKPELAKLYRIIWCRAVASQMASAVIYNMTITIISTNPKKSCALLAKGSRCDFKGYKIVYNDSDEQDTVLPDVKIGQAVPIVDVDVDACQTQPPKRYTEAGLIKKLEQEGIGRPSTYDKVISVLQLRGYVRRDGKTLIAEDKGWVVSSFLEEWFARYVANDFTADIEKQLDDVANGMLQWRDLMKIFWTAFQEHANKAMLLSPAEVQAVLQSRIGAYLVKEESCPQCEGIPIVKYSKNGGFIGCTNYPECKWIRPLTKNQHVLHEDDKDRVVLKAGPYGVYAFWEKSQKKVSIPANIKSEKINWDLVKQWRDLPRALGCDDDGREILLGIGRFGVYIRRVVDGAPEYRHVPASVNVQDFGLKEALEVFAKPKRIIKRKG